MVENNYKVEKGFVFVAKASLVGIISFIDWSELMGIKNFPTDEFAYVGSQKRKSHNLGSSFYYLGHRKIID